MKPSQEQEDIYTAIAETTDHLIVEAGAGSGKTTVLLGSIPYIDRSNRILLCAFNKAIAVELQKKTPGYVECRTTHSLAMSYCESQNIPTNPRKLSQAIDDLISGDLAYLKVVLYHSYKEVTNLVGLAKAYLVPTRSRKAFEKLIDDLNLDLDFGVEDFAYALFNQTALDKDTCDFDDQIYFAVTEKWATPDYDVIFVDEAQDLNKAQHELLKLTLKQGGRLICVGDQRQSIYRFRGSQPNSMEILGTYFKSVKKPLMTTWRCDQSIVAMANEIAGGLSARSTAPEGNIEYGEINTILSESRDGDFIIGRTNALLIEVAVQFVRTNRPFRMANKDQLKNARKRLKKWVDKKKGFPISSMNLVDRCKRVSRSQIGETDDIAIIQALASMSMNSTKVLDALEQILGAKHRKGPILMTVHGSKGLESERVFVISDNMPHEKVEESDAYAIEQEYNMAYVAVTRAKHELFIISLGGETKIEPFLDRDFMIRFQSSQLSTKPFIPKEPEKVLPANDGDSIVLDEATLKLLGG